MLSDHVRAQQIQRHGCLVYGGGERSLAVRGLRHMSENCCTGSHCPARSLLEF